MLIWGGQEDSAPSFCDAHSIPSAQDNISFAALPLGSEVPLFVAGSDLQLVYLTELQVEGLVAASPLAKTLWEIKEVLVNLQQAPALGNSGNSAVFLQVCWFRAVNKAGVKISSISSELNILLQQLLNFSGCDARRLRLITVRLWCN